MLRRVRIPKPGRPGEWRPLSIPTVADRVVMTAAKLVLEPVFEAQFAEASYGRWGLCCQVSCGLSICRCSTASWWRNAKFSASVSRSPIGSSSYQGEHARQSQVGQSQQHRTILEPARSGQQSTSDAVNVIADWQDPQGYSHTC
ncbi:hypothetical protein [Streptomyces sp. NPDC002133]|uniref:hypothetical protein n=1 Tax=Streptomyces sp. NPDC002133 TaxID=3154409 RepID=UPI00331C943E